MRRVLVGGVGVVLLCMAGALFVVRASESPRPEAGTIGYVDLQRAIDETEDGKKANAEFRRVVAERQKQIAEARAALAADESSPMSTEMLKARRDEIEQLAQRYERELAAKQGALTAPLVARMNKTLVSLGQSRHLVAIVGQGAVYVNPANDLTDEAIRLFDRSTASTLPPAPEKAK